MRKTRTGKQIIKALSIGISASMMLQPVSAMANDIETLADPDMNNTELPEANAADTDVASKNMEALNVAEGKVVEAMVAESGVWDEAIENYIPGRYLTNDEKIINETVAAIANEENNDIPVNVGFIIPVFKDIDDSAYEFEKNAADHLGNAEEILKNAEKLLTGEEGTLDSFEEHIVSGNDYADEATKDYVSANDARYDADKALESAMDTSSSAVAISLQERAEKDYKQAENDSVNASYDANKAKEEYDAACEEYEKAKREAHSANVLANKAIAAGLIDAEIALADAKEADERAQALKGYIDAKLEEAKRNGAYWQKGIDEADKALTEWNKYLATLQEEYGEKNSEYVAKKQAYEEAKTALNTANTNKTNAASSVSEIEAEIAGLESALTAAEALQKEASENYETVSSNEGIKNKLLEEANAAVAKLKSELERAYSSLEEANSLKTSLEGTKAQLENDFGKGICELIDELKNADEELREGKAAKVIEKACELTNVEKFDAGTEYPVFKGLGKNGYEYYTYSVDSDGNVIITNVIYEVASKKQESGELTFDQYQDYIDSLQEGTFFVNTKEEQVETGYFTVYFWAYGDYYKASHVSYKDLWYYDYIYYVDYVVSEKETAKSYNVVSNVVSKDVSANDDVTGYLHADEARRVGYVAGDYLVTIPGRATGYTIGKNEEPYAGYEYKYTYGKGNNKEFFTKNNTLKWVEPKYETVPASGYGWNYRPAHIECVEEGHWEYFENGQWHSIKSQSSNHCISEYYKDSEKHVTIDELKDYSDYETIIEGNPGEWVRRVYFEAEASASKGADEKNINNFDNDRLNDLSLKLAKYNSASIEASNAQENYNNAYAALQEALEAKNNADGSAKTAKEAKEGKDQELQEAKQTLENAKIALATAEQNKRDAKKAKEDAEKALKSVNSDIASANWYISGINREKAEYQKQLTLAESAKANWEAKQKKAADLQTATADAYEAAKAAKNAIRDLLCSSNVGADAIKKAQEELEALENAYNEALTASTNAANEAKLAKEDYEKIVARVAKLLADEASRRDEESVEPEEENVLVIPEELTPVAAPVLTTVRPVAAVIPTVVTEAEEVKGPEVEEVVIEEEETPTVSEPEAATVIIPDEEVALSDEEKAEMSWWWLLVVLVLGTAGAELYRRHQKKKAEEALDSEK